MNASKVLLFVFARNWRNNLLSLWSLGNELKRLFCSLLNFPRKRKNYVFPRRKSAVSIFRPCSIDPSHGNACTKRQRGFNLRQHLRLSPKNDAVSSFAVSLRSRGGLIKITSRISPVLFWRGKLDGKLGSLVKKERRKGVKRATYTTVILIPGHPTIPPLPLLVWSKKVPNWLQERKSGKAT